MRGAILLLTLCCGPLWACGLDDAQRISLEQDAELFYRFARPLRVSQPADMALQFCRAGQPLTLDRFKFDAGMPAHGHGMNYRPRVDHRGAGRYRVVGLIFHMPGQWQIEIDYGSAGTSHRLNIGLAL